jgi:sortase A
VRAVLHFVSSVLMVSGALLIADAGVTLAWQEPISKLMADRQQDKLETQLKDPPQRVIKRMPLEGDAIARIAMPAIDKEAFVVEGTDTESLRKGPGHYPETPLPGERGTIGIAGHRTTYGAPFRDIDQLDRGDEIFLDTPTATFVYRVERNRIVDDSAIWVTRRVGYDRLVLTACHPLHSAAQRVAVFARYVRREKARVS